MFWMSNYKAMKPLPRKPRAPHMPNGEVVLYHDYFYKRHPMFRNSWSARLIVITANCFMWVNALGDEFEPKRQFRKGRL